MHGQANIKLKWIFKKWNEGLDWIDLAQIRNRWWGLVNVIMNFRIPYNAGNLTARGLAKFLRTLVRGVNWLVSDISVCRNCGLTSRVTQ